MSRILHSIYNALAAGDLGLAAKILRLWLKTVWLAEDRQTLAYWKFSVLRLAGRIRHALTKGFLHAFYAVQAGWVHFTSRLRKAWTRIAGWFAKRWAWINSKIGA